MPLSMPRSGKVRVVKKYDLLDLREIRNRPEDTSLVEGHKILDAIREIEADLEELKTTHAALKQELEDTQAQLKSAHADLKEAGL